MNKVISFFKEAYNELKRVEFPTRREIMTLTVYVIGVSLSLGLFIAGLDYIFSQGLKALFLSKGI